jgi:hypothetical protein
MVAYKSHILRTSWLGFGSEVSRSDGHESSTVFVEMLSETRENGCCNALGGIPSPRSFTVVKLKKYFYHYKTTMTPTILHLE